MLQRIRHCRRLGSVVLTALMLAWAVALWANVQVRQALPAADLAQLAQLDICFATPSGEPQPHAAPGAPEAPGPQGAHHADPSCLLCVALATPFAQALAPPRPPAPRVHQARRSRAPAVPAWRAQAPLPPRGPPHLHA